MKKLFFILVLVAFALSACNIPVPTGGGEGLSPEQQAATVVALTLTAVAGGNPPIENTPLASPTAGGGQPLASPTAGGAPTLQPTITPTGGPTTLTVDSNTNCREGPGTTYTVVIVLVPGTTYQIIARSSDNKYWVITEIGKSNICWVPAEMSNAFGNVTLLPVITPAAPTASASGSVAAPTGLSYQYSCSFNGVNTDITVVLKWTDRSDNETGFRVYRDNALVVELPANTTTYTDLFAGSAVISYSYRISAFNALGEALGNPISFSCQ